MSAPTDAQRRVRPMVAVVCGVTLSTALASMPVAAAAPTARTVSTATAPRIVTTPAATIAPTGLPMSFKLAPSAVPVASRPIWLQARRGTGAWVTVAKGTWKGAAVTLKHLPTTAGAFTYRGVLPAAGARPRVDGAATPVTVRTTTNSVSVTAPANAPWSTGAALTVRVAASVPAAALKARSVTVQMRPLGQVAWRTVASGTIAGSRVFTAPLSRGGRMQARALITAAPGLSAATSPISTFTSVVTPVPPTTVSTLALAPQVLGVNLSNGAQATPEGAPDTYAAIRLWDSGTSWRNIEKSPGVYDWTRMDAIVADALSKNQKILYTAGSTPTFYATGTQRVMSIARAANVVTVTTSGAHGLAVGTSVTISNVGGGTPSFNGVVTIASVPSPTTFTYAQTGSNESGQVTANSFCSSPVKELYGAGSTRPPTNLLEPYDSLLDPVNPTPSQNAYANFIYALATRYAGKIEAYQSGNEVNLTVFWQGTASEAAEMTAITRAVVNRVNAATSTNALVVSSSLATRKVAYFYDFAVAYLAELGKRGWPVDVYTAHFYPLYASSVTDFSNLIGMFQRVLADSGAPTRPIWNTEVNFRANPTSADPLLPPLTEDEQRTIVAQVYLRGLSAGVSRTYWYGWMPKRVAGMLGIELWTDSAAHAGLQRLRGWLSSATAIHGCTTNTAKLTTCKLDTAAGARYVAWSEVKSSSLAPLGTVLEVQTLTSTDPVRGITEVGAEPALVTVAG